MLRSTNDGLHLVIPGAYRIPCDFDEGYVGQRGMSDKEIGVGKKK